MTALDQLQTACEALLAATVTTYASYGVPLPSRRMVTVNRPAGDSEEVAAWVARLYPGVPGREEVRPQPCGGPVTAEIGIELWRCHPTAEGNAPTTTTEETAAAATIHQDLLLLINAADLAAHTLGLDGEALTGGAVLLGPNGAQSGARALLAIPVARS